jgi:predicted DNA-binding transcriptional regulator AlpA
VYKWHALALLTPGNDIEKEVTHPMQMPRLLSGEEAARYCGVSYRTFHRYVAQGLFPQKIKGTLKWDRTAIDQAIDRLSNIEKGQANDDAQHLDGYQRWSQAQQRKSGPDRP